MKLTTLLFLAVTLPCIFSLHAQSIEPAFDTFDQIYKQQLGSTRGCDNPEQRMFRVCSDVLKNDGNAPFILHHNKVTSKVAVLFHGLSDSPFFLRSIAKSIHQQGVNVVVALTPGHGKKRADEDMQDPNMSDHWRKHVTEIMTFSKGLGEQFYIGGFSTGGVLATEYVLQNPADVKGLLLFSGALALNSTVESMSKIWGISWLMKLLDGEYQTMGGNPYKYPNVAKFSALELLEVIFSVRTLLEQGNGLNVPIFSAHSAADTITPISGIKHLMDANQGTNTLFEASKDLDVCHADLVISDTQLVEMKFNASKLEEIMPCDVPKANPKHAEMIQSLLNFIDTY